MATIYVNINANGNNNGVSWIDSYQSLDQAISASVSGDQIWIAQGVYTPTIEVGGAGSSFMSFTLKSGVKIYGGFIGNEISLDQRILSSLNKTVLDGTGKYHVVNVTNTALNNQTTLDGVTIKNGNANSTGIHSTGGGILFSSSAAGSSVFATISNCIIEDNVSVNEGGGIYASRYCNLILLNCVFNNNVADRRGGGYFGIRNNCQIYGCTFYLNRTTIISDTNAGGGAIFISSSVNTEFTNIAGCTFQSNVSASVGTPDTGKGGAIGTSVNPGRLAIYDCQFENNSAQFGGALALRSGGSTGRDNSYIIVKKCNFILNNSTYGGGIFVDNHNAFFINCKISGNYATQQSGGFYVRFGGPRMFSCLISGNKAGNYGGGIYFTNSLIDANRPRINNTTISGNYSERGGSIALINSSQCELNNCIVFDNDGELDGKSMHIATGCSILSDYSIYQNNTGDIHLEGTGSFSPTNSSSNNPLFINGILGSSANTPNILGDYTLQNNSPCIDNGLNSYCPCRNDAFGGLRNRSIQIND